MGKHNGMVKKSFIFRFNRYFPILLSAIALILVVVFPVVASPWQEIQQRGLLIGVKDNLPPLGYYSSTGELQGLEIDIAYRLGEELLGDRNAVRLIPLSNTNRLSAVINREVDMAIASISATPSRRRQVDFTDFYYLSSVGIIVKNTGFSPSLTNFQGKIGVLTNSGAIAELQYRFPQIPLQEISSYQQAWQLMETGEIQAFAGERSVLTGWAQQYPNYQLLNISLGSYPFAIALPRGRQYQVLRDKVNQTLRKLKREGWLEERVKHWGLS